jgi:hypothetical protein
MEMSEELGYQKVRSEQQNISGLLEVFPSVGNRQGEAL